MLPETLITRTRRVFPRLVVGEIAVEPLLKGGSDRSYYRIRMSDALSMILVKYGDQREENRHYVGIANFLSSLGVRVPKIYFHDDRESLIWMEDLGSDDLWAHRDAPWESRRILYARALDQVLKLHSAEAFSAVPAGLNLQSGFGEELYLWEQSYFFENCLVRHFGFDPAVAGREEQSGALRLIATRLAGLPRVLVHRDFQSQNIIIFDNEARLIDFQGLRPGLSQYDLASLLYDPYVTLTDEERDDLLRYYAAGAIEAGHRLTNEFEEIYYLCAMQRLMQALGAYGFLGHIRGREDFLAHIPVAVASLREILDRLGIAPSLRRLLDRCE